MYTTTISNSIRLVKKLKVLIVLSLVLFYRREKVDRQSEGNVSTIPKDFPHIQLILTADKEIMNNSFSDQTIF